MLDLPPCVKLLKGLKKSGTSPKADQIRNVYRITIILFIQIVSAYVAVFGGNNIEIKKGSIGVAIHECNLSNVG